MGIEVRYPNHQQLIVALNRTHNDVELRDIFALLQIRSADMRPDPLDKIGRRLIEDEARGFQLTFEDEGKKKQILYHDVGEGPWVLDGFSFWSGTAASKRYPGSLPYGLNFDWNRSEVRNIIGFPDTESALADYWAKGAHGLIVNYVPRTESIKVVGLQSEIAG